MNQFKLLCQKRNVEENIANNVNIRKDKKLPLYTNVYNNPHILTFTFCGLTGGPSDNSVLIRNDLSCN